MQKDFKFSVIIPIYNVGLYLEETINSIINQTIGFKDNIELILVNDGSKDNSGSICEKYLELYPENVIYINQKNAGVSSARNAGIKKASGKYVNFFDGDDIWKNDVFKKAWDFFEEHYDEIDVVACRQKFFGGKNAYQSLDYKFKDGNRVIDINEYPSYIQMSVASSFFKTDVAKKYTYDERLKYGEDAKYLTDIILEKEKYGILADALYLIRKRKEETSATQGKKYSDAAYMTTVKYYYQYIYDLSIKKYGKVIPYIGYALVNALKYRVSTRIPEDVNITLKEQEEYKKAILKLVKSIDDEIICSTNRVNLDTKLYLLSLKNKNIEKDLVFKDTVVYYKDIEVGKLKGTNNLDLTDFKIKNNECFVKGYLKMSKYFKFDRIYVDEVGKTYAFNLKEDSSSNRLSLFGEDVNYVTTFEGSFNFYKGLNRFVFYSIYDNTMIPFIINFDSTYKDDYNKKYIFKDKIIIKKCYLIYLLKTYLLKLLSYPFK